MMLESNSEKQRKFKASLEDFIEPLLNQLSCCPEDAVVEKIRKLLERNMDVIKSTQDWESKQMSLLGKIERHINYWKEDKGENNELLGVFEKLLEKEGLDDVLMFTTRSDEDEERLSQNNTISEVGEPSYSNNQEGDISINLEEYTKGLREDQKNCLNSLGIFPEHAKLKKKLLLNWWIGMWLETWEAEKLFGDLICNGILKPFYTREHNGVIDLCTIDRIIHEQLVSAGNFTNFGSEGTLRLCIDPDRNWSTALLNVDQKYLNSKDIKSILAKCKYLDVVQLGRWDCTNDAEAEVKGKKSRNHIEVDDTNFLKRPLRDVRFLSLRGISSIEEIPESIAGLPLRILDLRACHNLQKLPDSPPKKSHLGFLWFSNLTYLDISECYLLDHMPKWICELYSLKVLKGFVAGSVGKKTDFCRLGDLSKLLNLQKLSIRISKHWDPEEAIGLKSLDSLSVLTVIWGKTENENKNGKTQTIFFPRNLEKLDIRCYPEEDAAEVLNPAALPKLKRLYIRGGKLTKLKVCRWKVKILRLRFLNYLELEWVELCAIFPKLDYVEYKQCPRLRNFPENRSACNMKTDGASGRVELDVIYKLEAPLGKNELNLLLQLTGSILSDRPKLDLVAILDLSRAMAADDKLENMKTALLFVIKKLRSLDRLSIVIFSTDATMLWPLQQVNESSQKELEDLVKNFKADDRDTDGATNIIDGLHMGLDILKDPTVISSTSQVKSIILVSSATQIGGAGDASCTSIGDVAVHTFGFGKDHDPMVLKSIACKSIGGTFSEVRDTNNLTKAFAVCLSGLLNVAAQDLTLTLNPIEDVSTIERVSAGDYMQYSKDNGVGQITIKFGDLYIGEVRRVLVNLVLPDVNEERWEEFLKVSYSCKMSGNPCGSSAKSVRIHRMQTVQADQEEVPELTNEEAIMEAEKDVIQTIAVAYTQLDLKSEHGKTMEFFNRSFAYSFLTSINKQRSAARGDDIEKSSSLFGIPSMSIFLEDARDFLFKRRYGIRS